MGTTKTDARNLIVKNVDKSLETSSPSSLVMDTSFDRYISKPRSQKTTNSAMNANSAI